MVYPLLVAFLSIIFAWQVATEYTERKRPYQAIWATALVMSAAASMGYLGALANGSPWAFRIYYVFGALLVAPYMGLGSLYLVLAPKIAKGALWFVNILGIVGAVFILRAPIHAEGMATLAGSSGQGVLEAGPWLPFVIILNVFGTLAVSGVALFSAIRSAIRRQHGLFTLGNLTLAAGFILIGLAGSVARWWVEWDGAFWMTMATGWLIAFGGFRIISVAIDRRVQKTVAV